MDLKFILILLLSIGWVYGVHSQDVKINNIVATDIIANEDDVIEIKFIDQLPNLPFLLAWIDEDGKQYALRFVTSRDDLIIPLKGQQGWEGEIGLVGLSINNVDVTFRKSNFRDQWRVFMTSYQLSPGSVNFTGSYFLKEIEFRWICLGFMIVLWMILFWKMRNFQLALILSFLIAWGIYDLRSTKNRWDIMSELSANNYQIDIFQDLDVFLTQAREIIGEQPWTKEQMPGVLNSYITYQLADLQYKPAKSQIRNEADFIITPNPTDRKVVFNHGAYYLVIPNHKR